MCVQINNKLYSLHNNSFAKTTDLGNSLEPLTTESQRSCPRGCLAQIHMLALLTLFAGLCGMAQAEMVLPEIKAEKSYAVIVSEETSRQKEWMEVVTALRTKYDGSLIIYPSGQVGAVLPELKKLHPRYAAFVTRPEEAGRMFVVAVHRLTRKLDQDPYTDLRWGIVTGYEAADALRIARRSQVLIISSAASSMGPGVFKNLAHGFASSEGDRNLFWIKKKGGVLEKQTVADDPIKSLVDAFNNYPPDLFQTSGHASEKDWQAIYNVNAGSFRCDNGQLFGLNSKNKRFDINSPHPKIYMPMGNCLIGNIPDKNCMATAWMHTGGVYQMFGYTSVTFHGYMGWGVGTYFGNQYSLSESFFFNNQALIWDLQKSFPKQARIEFDDYDRRRINQLARKYKIADKKLMGHLWDRDLVAFYGDPAWKARYSLKNPVWKASYSHVGENVKITVSILKSGKWGNRPLAVPLPERLGRIRLIKCSHNLSPLVTDDFVLLPVAEKPRQAGQVIELIFGAYSIDAKLTSASQSPLLVGATSDTPRTDKTPPTKFDLKPLGLSEDQNRCIRYAYKYAQKNSAQIIKALQDSCKNEVKDMSFLVANMPLRDLTSLDADYLLENLRYAQKAFAEAPWKDKVSPELYREYILPYANLTEKRESWRKGFYEKLQPLVKGIDSPGDVAVKLNQTIYELFKVKYHPTKRPRPDQGPLESIKAGFASCTGLSVLLVDACRSVGIPARVAGVAQWTKGPGNHTWVEVWDGTWHCLGAAESKKLNQVWFGEGAAAADTGNSMKRVYAASFSRTTLHFPVAWNPYACYVPAIDVSQHYKELFGIKEEQKTLKK